MSAGMQHISAFVVILNQMPATRETTTFLTRMGMIAVTPGIVGSCDGSASFFSRRNKLIAADGTCFPAILPLSLHQSLKLAHEDICETPAKPTARLSKAGIPRQQKVNLPKKTNGLLAGV
jgi:hypothetical protein